MAAARLNHPNIVTIYSADVYDGRPAIVMELVEGAMLSDLLRSGPLEPNAAVDALDQLLEAAAYAHSMGVVHRAPRPVTTWRWDALLQYITDGGIPDLRPLPPRCSRRGIVPGAPRFATGWGACQRATSP